MADPRLALLGAAAARAAILCVVVLRPGENKQTNNKEQADEQTNRRAWSAPRCLDPLCMAQEGQWIDMCGGCGICGGARVDWSFDE